MSIEIRAAKVKDAASLTILILRSKQSNGYDEVFMRACRDELRVTPETLSSGEYWVAHCGNSLCGCASLIANHHTAVGRIADFFIDPNWQRQGVGRLLWDKIQTRALEQQLTKLYLDADPFAVPFYEAMGFQVAGEAASGSIKGRMLPRMEIRIDNI